jgi:hypothetical protein
MDARVSPLQSLLSLQGRLYLNCLLGMTDEQGLLRPSRDANHTAFIALHLLDSRYVMARLVGGPGENPVAAILEHAGGIEDVAAFPSLDELRSGWRAVSEVLVMRFGQIESAALDLPCPPSLPVLRIGEGTVLDGVAFLLHHESYHIGQMALLRKLAGLGAMSYREQPAAPSAEVGGLA